MKDIEEQMQVEMGRQLLQANIQSNGTDKGTRDHKEI